MLVAHFADALRAAGCRRGYGLPGEDHVELMDALVEAGIRYTPSQNETSAVLMAAADAETTGQPGVALVSMSTGLTNAMNGLAHAHMEQVPVIVISGQHAASRLPFVIRQGLDLESIVRPFVKWSARVDADTDVYRLIDKASRIANTTPRGPVYIELSADVARSTRLPSDPTWASTGIGSVPADSSRRGLAATESAALTGSLNDATRPVAIIGGRDARLSAAQVSNFSQAYRIPYFLTSAQKGVGDPTDEFYAGTFLNGSPERNLLNQADLIVAVNLDAFDLYSRALPGESKLISVSDAPINDIAFAFDHEYLGDVSVVIDELTASCDAASQWNAGDVASYRADLRESLLTIGAEPAAALPLTRAIDILTSLLPPETTLVPDAGFTKPLIAHLWDPTRAGSYLVSNGFGTMGHALPTAITAALIDREHPVVATMGDGSFLMRLGELATVKNSGAVLRIIVFLDEALTQIAVKQHSRHVAELGITLPALTVADIAAGFDLIGTDVYSEAGLTEVLQPSAGDGTVSSDAAHVIGVHVSNAHSAELFEFLRGS